MKFTRNDKGDLVALERMDAERIEVERDTIIGVDMKGKLAQAQAEEADALVIIIQLTSYHQDDADAQAGSSG